MRKLAMNLALLTLAACAGEPSAPTSDAGSVLAAESGAYRETYRVDVPIDYVVSPSDYPCLSEPIHVFGSYEEHLVFVDSPGSIHLTVHQSTDNVSAVGLTTGDTYQVSGPLTYTASGQNADGVVVEFTFHNINHFVGPGRDSNIYFRTLVHVTRDPATGAPKVVVFMADVLCN
jgi:hypothetical protein